MPSDDQPNQCIHRLFEERAAAAPDAMALSYDQCSLSYGELNRRANQVARHLERMGVGAEMRVGIYLERSLELVIGVLGVLKAGSAYVPLDPTYPIERVDFMLRDADAGVVLTLERYAENLPAFWGQVVCLDADWDEIAAEDEENLSSVVTPENIAYVTYTSGSTGQPKGAAIPHRSIPGFMFGVDYVHFDSEQSFFQYSAISWDVFTLELWSALLHGARSVLYPGQVPTPEELGAAIRRHNISILWLTSSFFNTVIDILPEALATVDQLLVGGEALSIAHVCRALDLLPDARIVNGYGPSECTVFTCCYPIHNPLANGLKSIPIGRPIGDRRVYVLSPRLQRVPVGVPGELQVGGPGIARGYLNHPALTAEKFVPNQFGSEPGARLYKTGDQVRFLSDGRLEFVGRLDHQVKVRGFRIELGEIEAALARHPGVKQAVVMACENQPGPKQIVAYVKMNGGVTPSNGELRQFAREILPEYMVPATFVRMDRLPLTATGKVDRRALPAPDQVRPDLTERHVAPRTPTEQIIAEVWAEVLGLDKIGVHDSYFDLGGDSIRSIQAAAKAKERGVNFSLEQLFERPTIAELAQAIDGIGAVAIEDGPDLPCAPFELLTEGDREQIPEGIEAAYPLTRLQAGMVFHSEFSTETAVYHDIVSYHFQAPLDAAALRTAFSDLIERHAILRTSFDLTGFSEPVQLVHRRIEPPFEVQDLSHLSTAEQDAALADALHREKYSPFDWRESPLLRMKVFPRTTKTFQLLISFHHAILDGWSVATFFTELFQHYWRLLGRRDDDIGPAPKSTFRDYVALERRALDSEECRRYWGEKLSGACSAELPRWPSVGGEGKPRGVKKKGAALKPEIIAGLNRLAVAAGVPLKSVMLAAHMRVLNLITGHGDVTTGLASHGRPEVGDGERALGLYLNTVPFRLLLMGGTWEELARQTFESEREMLPFRRYPMAEIQQTMGGRPLFETLFSFLHFHIYQDLHGLQDEMALLGRESVIETNFTLAVHFLQDPFTSVMQLILDYDDSELCGAQCELLLSYYERTMEAMASGPTARYETISPLSAAERHQLLVDWNDIDYGSPETVSLARYLEIVDSPEQDLPANSAGRPARDVRFLVLDEWLQPAPIGSIGELYVGGDGLALGYAGRRTAATAERFIPDPHGQGAWLFKTGDWACYRPDGKLEIVERIEHSEIVVFDPQLKEERDYWIKRLSRDLPASSLAPSHSRLGSDAASIEMVEVELDDSTYRRLSELTGDAPFLLYTTLLSVLKVCLYRYTGNSTITVGSPALREVEGVKQKPNALAIITEIDDRISLRDLLLDVRETLLEAYARQRYPFQRLVSDLNQSEVENRGALFDVLLALADFHGDTPELKNNITITAARAEGALAMRIEYNARLFEKEAIERFSDHFACLLGEVGAGAGQSLAELRMVTPAEARLLAVEWNKTAGSYQDDCCLHELVEAQCELWPDALAVSYEGESLTYTALNAHANRLARYLVEMGVGPEVRVGICVERSKELVIALLAILKAGGAYVPLDPAYPKDRLSFIIENAQTELLITQERLLATLPGNRGRTLCLDTIDGHVTDLSSDNLSNKVTPGNLAYVIYTSGSTGHPKGALIGHRGLCNLTEAQTRVFNLRPENRVLQFASLSFDASIFEIVMALSVGATLYLGSPDSLAVGSPLRAFLKQHEITNVTLPPTVLSNMSEDGLAALHTVIAAGEACSEEIVTRWAAGRRFFNAYGPTETTVWASVSECVCGGRPTIGRPIFNTQIYILDSNARLTGIGAPGELHIGGDGLARGYLHQPDRSAERFIPNPFDARRGSRLYKTGDLARYNTAGEIEFLGRIDYQVKVRGYRIELREIELALLQCPGVSEAAVIVREDEPGAQRLVGYFVAADGKTPEGGELRSFLHELLPDYMAPAIIVRLAAMPLSPNGKVDRRALPKPEQSRPGADERPDSHHIPEEEILAGIWEQVLGIERVGTNENFFDLGGHSLLAMQVMSRTRECFQVEVPLREIFVAPTVAKLAAVIREAKRAGGKANPTQILPVNRQAPLPLSFAQQRLWFIDQLIPNSHIYNNPTPVRLAGPINLTALEQGLSEITRRHEVLRTTFIVLDAEPAQVINKYAPSGLPLVDLSGLPASTKEAAARKLVSEESCRPFDLNLGPLLRSRFLRLNRHDHVSLLTMHHIITDGWSIGVFTQEIATLYDAFTDGRPSPLAELPIQYADYAFWQRNWFQGEALTAQLAYWKRHLGDNLPVLRLPTDRPRPAAPTWRGQTQSSVLPPDLLLELQHLSRRQGVTLFMTLLAAFQTLLYRYANQDEIVVGTDIANRRYGETEALIGLFVNLLVLRTDMSGNPSFIELLGRVREVALGAYANQDMPYDKLVEELQPERNLSYTPLFQVLFILQNTSREAFTLSGLPLQPVGVSNVTSRFDLTLSMMETEHGLVGTWRYSADLFDDATITRLMRHFEELLNSIKTRPETRLNALEMRAEDERKQREIAEQEREKAKFKKLKNVKPRPVSLPKGELVRMSLLDDTRSLPLVIQPVVPDVNLARWASSNREMIEKRLLEHGAILFRGFGTKSVAEFEKFAQALCARLFGEYGDLPRENVSENIYGSTPYPPDQAILFHNESSHLHQWPQKIWFYCVQAAAEGGETPIIDCRKVYQLIDPLIRDQFERKKLVYIRNYIEGLDVTWQEFFQTDDRAVVEEYCRRASIELEWGPGNRLTTRKICAAVTSHPQTGEKVFFNQVQLHHPSCLDPAVRDSLRAMFGGDEALPRNVQYGDGAPISDDVIARICAIYDQAKSSFPWREGDILMLDNMLTAHSRSPFVGPRKIVVAMGDMISHDQAMSDNQKRLVSS